ncbi:MAG: amidohydrolase family protein [Vicinamibacterales bacterium]|nr:amidohydrolase family protein [Vicinamibacterales bacterium]
MQMRLNVLLAFLVAAGIAAPAGAQTTAFVGGRVIDGTGRVLENATVIVRDGQIRTVGAAAAVPVPEGATRIDLTGKTLMPGLINAHGHVAATDGLQSNPAFYTRENLERQLRTYADYGVTTVFSLGDDREAGFVLRNEQGGATLNRARLFVGGEVITGRTAEEAGAHADRVAAWKPDLLKIRVDDNLGRSPKMPPEAWRAVLQRANAHGLPLAVHIFYLADAQALLDAGAAFIGHSVRDVPVDDRFIRDLKARDVCYCPTLTRELSTFIYDSTPPWVNDPFFLKGVDGEVARQLADPARQAALRASPASAMGQQYKAGLAVATRNLKRLADAGVRIAFGTDSGPPARFQGFFEHLELEMMVEAGLTPMQAIVSATGDAARCWDKAGQLGSIEPGVTADLIVLDRNPLDDIRHLRAIDSVWIGGVRVVR